MWWLALVPMLSLAQQNRPEPDHLDRVLSFRPTGISGRPLAYDRGAAGVWQLLRKLQTTASVLHTTAHPDDEHVGMLTRLGRGDGVRTALLTLNRGEGGANAIGPELFDALGIVRTEELRLAGSYYGLDDHYFTTAIDYGFSKTFREAESSWDLDAVLEDMVRIIRLNRPLVVVSRFHGSERDGHGHHQAAGILTPLAVEAAADPERYPAQIAEEGLRPWRVRKVYRGGVRTGEPLHLIVDAGGYSPWLGDTYEAVGRYGVSLQRSQTAGRLRSGAGPALYRYERLVPREGADRESDPWDGLPVSVSAIFDLTGEPSTTPMRLQLRQLESMLRDALDAFSLADPSACVPALTRALRLTRGLIRVTDSTPDARFLLRIKERQLERAIVGAAGLGIAVRAEAGEDGVAVPDQTVNVSVETSMPSDARVTIDSVTFLGARSWTLASDPPPAGSSLVRRYAVTVGEALSVPYVHRRSISENRYVVRDSASFPLSSPRSALTARISLHVNETPITVEVAVRIRHAVPPRGSVYPVLTILPPVSVALHPAMLIHPAGSTFDREVDLVVTNHDARGVQGRVQVVAPRGLSITPSSLPFGLDASGEQFTATFHLSATADLDDETRFGARAIVGTDTIGTDYVVIEHGDLERRVLDRSAEATLRTVDVTVPEGLVVGYVMGVGDDVPAAIEQLGVGVHLLSAADVASADLSIYDAIVVGTRAYAVRPDLISHQRRLMQFAENGGHLIVLYQTQEFVPDQMAPFPGELPANAEEVSEESAPVRILAPHHPLLTTPNVITVRDFDGWIEQRGSKFLSTWDSRYTPLIETHDTGQAPQRGVWLSAPVGRGRYTYIALALHRQLPYGVAGAYRLLANLLAQRPQP